MITPTNLNSLLEVVRDFARDCVEHTDLTKAEDDIQKIIRMAGNAMMCEAAAKISGKSTYKGVRIVCECGGEARFKEYRERYIKTLHGDVKISRAYYCCEHCGQTYMPWDQEQGMNERIWTPRVKELVASMCAALTYEAASSLIKRTCGLAIEESSEEDIVRDVSKRLRQEEQDEIIAVVDTGEGIPVSETPGRLYIGIDAAKAHTDGEWHDIKTAVVYEGILPEGKDVDTVINPRYIAAQETSEDFGRRICAKAVHCGYERAAEQVVIGDGAEWIWNEARNHFPKATKIIDYWHACEHIYNLAQELYEEGDHKGKRWAEDHCRKLKEKGPNGLIRAMRRRKARNEKDQEALRLELGYFTKYRKYMDYPTYRAKGMMIGSGPVESACKIIVGQRLKQAGMRWTRDGADSVLAVRTSLLSGELGRIERAARAA